MLLLAVVVTAVALAVALAVAASVGAAHVPKAYLWMVPTFYAGGG